jgi:cytochrome bd-type quinol oxidase subunit 2
MALAFRDRARDLAQSKGTLALFSFMLHVIRDWLTTATHERLDMDMAHKLNRVSTVGLIVLSSAALVTVLPFALRAVLTGHVPPPEPDEGTGAHIFQLSIVALLPMGLLFLTTADWTKPLRSVRRLAFPAAAVVFAFSILFYFEHYYFPAHGAPLPRAGLPLRLLRQVLGAVGA